jgi:UDP-2,4-diacetamido-2,4,6-trideoxy-beta-L-altropyranose hydrolase
LVLADALVSNGAEVRVVTRLHDIDVSRWFERRTRVVQVALPVDGEGQDPGDDARATAVALEGWRPDWVVVDDYGLDALWHRIVRDRLGCRVAAIDDLADRPLDVDLLVDHNLREDARDLYARVLRRPDTRVLCGPRHALIGSAYASATRWSEPAEVSIGVFLGGTDPGGASARVLDSIRRHAGFSGPVEIVSTSANPRLGQLRDVAAGDRHCRLSVDLADLAGFYARHTMQVGAGGGATWERCCIGAPTLALVLADNQRVVVSALVARGVVATTDDSSGSSESIGRAVAALLADRDRRSRMSDAARQLVDGAGATRVALAIQASTLKVRLATRDDARHMFDWRNHPATREVSRSPEPLVWEQHLQWLEKVLIDTRRRLYVGVVGARPVGVVRMDRLGLSDDVEVSLFLDPALLGLGLGRPLLSAAQDCWRADGAGGSRFVATVLPSNVASRALFESLDYCRAADDRYVRPFADAWRTDYEHR